MRTTVSRSVAPFVILVLSLTAHGITHSKPASSAELPTESSFIMTVFPHDTTAVNFWDSWGARRSGGRRHGGIDIMSPRGTQIRAVADGVVTELGHHSMSGYFIRVDHGEGWLTTYMHLNNDTLGTDDGEGGSWTAFFATLAEGTDIRAGQVIGYVGDSGNAEDTQPHTHLEVRYDGEKVNPFPFLRDAWEREMRLLDELQVVR